MNVSLDEMKKKNDIFTLIEEDKMKEAADILVSMGVTPPDQKEGESDYDWGVGSLLILYWGKSNRGKYL